MLYIVQNLAVNRFSSFPCAARCAKICRPFLFHYAMNCAKSVLRQYWFERQENSLHFATFLHQNFSINFHYCQIFYIQENELV